jgi:GT2 family glycosyltransferase
VAFSDDDSWWSPGALARAVTLLRGDPRLALVAARVLVEPGARLDPTCRRMEQADRTLPGPQLLGFVACGAVVRRSAFLASGGFEPRFQIGAEESLLSLDLAAAGWRLVYARDVVAHHRPFPGERSGRVRRQLRNALWTAWLRRPLSRALTVTARLVTEAGADGPPSLAAALHGLPWVVRRRRVLPPDVERAARAIERRERCP